MSIYVRARFDARDQAAFEAIVSALSDQARDEPGTLTYRWFSAGPGGYIVIEEYVDPAAAIAHNERGAELLARVPECADMAYAELHGDIGPQLQEWGKDNPRVTLYPDFP